MIKGRIGCEIEGLIPTNKANSLKKLCLTHNINYGEDGSINRLIESESLTHCIELRGMGLVFDTDKTKEMFKLIDRIFKRDLMVNKSCGLHFHISFTENGNYFKLLSWDFVDKFQNAIKNLFVSDYEKLRLNAYYCGFYENENNFNWRTKEQTAHISKCSERYNSVNFNSFNVHKTIEFRIFPATNDIKQFKKYAEFLLNFIEDYLKTAQKLKIQEEYKPREQNNNFIITIINEDLTPCVI